MRTRNGIGEPKKAEIAARAGTWEELKAEILAALVSLVYGGGDDCSVAPAPGHRLGGRGVREAREVEGGRPGGGEGAT
jgi:hypothetical protein